jgi:hypothetical protein
MIFRLGFRSCFVFHINLFIPLTLSSIIADMELLSLLLYFILLILTGICFHMSTSLKLRCILKSSARRVCGQPHTIELWTLLLCAWIQPWLYVQLSPQWSSMHAITIRFEVNCDLKYQKYVNLWFGIKIKIYGEKQRSRVVKPKFCINKINIHHFRSSHYTIVFLERKSMCLWKLMEYRKHHSKV